jgi:hypothetical protein
MSFTPGNKENKPLKPFRFTALLAGVLLVAAFSSGTRAAGLAKTPDSSAKMSARAPLRTSLHISSPLVDVGQRVTFSVVAPVPSTVHISFQSFHHAFTGTAVYQRTSRTYVESVYLIARAHATERAHVVVTVTPRRPGRSYRLYGQFFIRGESMSMNTIPQNNGGDHDGDNNGAPTDGDGDQ